MELQGATPAEVKFIYHLLFRFEQKGRFRKALNKNSDRKKRYTKSEIANYLDSHTDYSKRYADSFVNKLEKDDVLIPAGQRQNSEGGDDIWKLDKKQLGKAFRSTEYYQENKKLFARMLDESFEGLDLTGNISLISTLKRLWICIKEFLAPN